MNKPKTLTERIVSGTDKIVGQRGRIALVIGALGAMAPATACNFSFKSDINLFSDSSAENDAKAIHIPGGDAVIVLGMKDVDGGQKIEGMLSILPESPLYNVPDTPRCYNLTDDAYPWHKVVAHPSGKIILQRADCEIAVVFTCASMVRGTHTYCQGVEADPRTLNFEQNNTPDAGVATPGTSHSHETGTDFILNHNPTNPRTLRLREPLLNADFAYLKALARYLAGQQYESQTEQIIRDVMSDRESKDYRKPDLVTAIQFLLDQPMNQQANRTAEVERNFGIDPNSDPNIVDGGTTTIQIDSDGSTGDDVDAGVTTDGGDSQPETVNAQSAQGALGQIRSILNTASEDKIRKTAAMISANGIDYSGQSKERVLNTLNDYLGQHYDSHDYKTLTAVLHYLKGSVTSEDRAHIREMYEHEIQN